jgi:hypothetical protein
VRYGVLSYTDTSSVLTSESYTAHPFFQKTDFECHTSVARPTTQYANAALFGLVQQLHDADKARALHEPLRAFADDVQSKVEALNERDRALLMHLLERKQLLHLTSIYPRFFASPSQGRCLLARNGGYVGLSHNLQNQWSDAFTFMMVRIFMTVGQLLIQIINVWACRLEVPRSVSVQRKLRPRRFDAVSLLPSMHSRPLSWSFAGT